MENLDLDALLVQARGLFQSVAWWYWPAGGGVLLVLILVWSLRNRGKKKQARAVAPRLVLHAFQLSPLGRDAFFKIRNAGEEATVSDLRIKGRQDIVIKNSFAGHRIEREKVYGLLLEATGRDKIGKDFIVELVYLDQLGNVYKQSFPVSRRTARQAKILRYA